MTASTADLLDLEGGAFLMGSEDPGGFPKTVRGRSARSSSRSESPQRR